MNKITIKGSEYLLPEELCVSCSGLPKPDTHIVFTFATKGYRKKFEFPACDHCASLHRKYWKRSMWIISTLIIAPIIYVTLMIILSEDFMQSVNRIIGGKYSFMWFVLVAVFAGIVFLIGKFGEALAIRSLGDPSPPLKKVVVSSLAPGMTWTFHFENESYAEKFRALNLSIVKGAEKPASIGV